eukprot:GGOE01013674.1.p2 GENE.GGOE01013674.1~~GGOE01013674.1.p2  ORF type:complete len:184 (+),score=42.81 GGOE01013674.1:49-600(+)
MAATTAPRTVRAFLNLGYVLKDQVVQMFADCAKYGQTEAFLVGRKSPLKISLGTDCYVEVTMTDRNNTLPLLRTLKGINDRKLLHGGNKRVGAITFVTIDTDAWIMPQVEKCVADGKSDRDVLVELTQLVDGSVRGILDPISQVPSDLHRVLANPQLSLLAALEHKAAAAGEPTEAATGPPPL